MTNPFMGGGKGVPPRGRLIARPSSTTCVIAGEVSRGAPCPKRRRTDAPGRVGGRLLRFAGAWKGFVSDAFVLRTVSEGYAIEFTGRPPLRDSPRFQSLPRSLEQRQALEAEIDNLLAKGAIKEVSGRSLRDPSFYSHLFMRPKPSGAWRPILNLRGLNRNILPKKFRMDTLQVVANALEVGEYVTSIDLKDAYFHIAVSPKDRRFLRFAVDTRVFEFQVLPFGLSTAPRVFTRVIQVLIAHLRKLGLKVFAYLDDWLIAGRDHDVLAAQTRLAVRTTEEAGFIINGEKSELTPTQSPIYLGASLDMCRGLIYPTMTRLETLERFVGNLLSEGSAPALFWLQMLGRMASMKGLIPFSLLNMRWIQFCLQSQWNRRLPMSKEITFPQSLVPCLRWWLDRNNTLLGVPFKAPIPHLVLTTDASNLGWGGHIDDMKTSGLWETAVESEHINMLELRAVFRSLTFFRTLVRNKTVLVQSDNTTVVAYINHQGGTRSFSLCRLTLDLFKWLAMNNTTLVASYLPGVQNAIADGLSRGKVSPTEWALHKGIVKQLFHSLGRPHIDLFASAENAVLPTFCTRLPHPQAWGTDALSLSWAGMFAYAYPPLSLLNRVLEKVGRDPCRILLIAPFWPRQHWFQRLVNLLVEPPLVLPIMGKLLSQQRGVFFPQPENLHLTAWLLSSHPSERQGFLSRLPLWRPQPGETARLKSMIPEFVVGLDGANREVMIPVRHL